MATDLPAPAFDDAIHAPVRLRICGLLRHVEQADFGVVRDTLAISDASLSKHVKVLAERGYVAIAKERSMTRSDARRLTWLSLTPAGRRAFDAHLAELQRLASGELTPGG